MSVPSRSDSTVKACVVSIFSFRVAKIACASCSVRPITGKTPGMISTSSGRRPLSATCAFNPA